MPDQSSAATEHAILQEITQPLETLPDDPLAVVNAEFSTTLRGYDRMEVDEYVRQTRRLVAELQATRSPEAAVRRALERVGEQISGILQRAHETAEQITAQSRTEAEDRLEQVRGEAADVAEAAEQRVRDLDADTDRIWLERQRIVADAEDLAGQLLALAKTAGERFPADADVDVDVSVGGDDAATGDDEYLEEPELPDHSEIERTMAFQPLEPSDPETPPSEPPEPAAGSGSEAADRPPQSPGAADSPPARQPGGFTDDDATAVIPPASQAANRRLSH
jgi:DivIVA domain-containing protein